MSRALPFFIWLVALASFAFDAGAQGTVCGSLATGEFDPSPSFDNLETVVRVSGVWPTVGPRLDSFSVVGDEVRVNLLGQTGGPATAFNYEFQVPIGMLAPGIYTIFVDVTWNPGTAIESSISCGPTQGTVLQAPGAAVPTRCLGDAGVAGFDCGGRRSTPAFEDMTSTDVRRDLAHFFVDALPILCIASDDFEAGDLSSWSETVP